MIKFFRKKRKAELEKGKVKNYLLYAIGEIVLVVVGILLALYINNLNQKSIENKRNLELLENVSAEAQLNIDRANLLKDRTFPLYLAHNDSIIQLLDRGLKKTDFKFMTQEEIWIFHDFNMNKATFEQLKSTGALYTIGSDSLITHIQKYYQLCEREAEYNRIYSKELEDIRFLTLQGWFEFRYEFGQDSLKALNYHKWLYDSNSQKFRHLRQFVFASKNHCQLMTNKLNNIIENSEKLKEVVKNEIEAK